MASPIYTTMACMHLRKDEHKHPWSEGLRFRSQPNILLSITLKVTNTLHTYITLDLLNGHLDRLIMYMIMSTAFPLIFDTLN